MADLIDKTFKAGATPDWIGPTIKVLGDLMNGGGHAFAFSECHMTPREIEWMLRKHGVTTWGLMHAVGTGMTMITVKQAQARYAEGLLNKAGIPLESKAPAAQRRAAPRQQRPITERSHILKRLEGRR